MTTITKPTNQDLEDYIIDKKFRNLSDITLKNYNVIITRYLKWIENQEITDFNKNLKKYRNHLSKTLSPSSIRTHIITIKTFLNSLNYETKVELPKKKKSLPKAIRKKDIDTIRLNIINESPKIKRKYKNYDEINLSTTLKRLPELSIRNLLIIDLLYTTGMRISELQKLNLKNIDITTGSIKILGKGNKERIVYTKPSTLIILKTYLYKRTRKGKPEHEAVFLTNTGTRLQIRQLQNIVTTNAKKVGIKVSAHQIRHSMAVRMLEQGANLKTIQQLLGHENISTTQIYLELDDQRIKNDYSKVNF